MIRLVDVSARAAPYSLSNLSLEVGSGSRAALGRPADGSSLLLAVLAGWVRPKRGEVLVLGVPPEKARRHIAYVPLDARLPPSLRVAEALEIAARIRGESAEPAEPRLNVLGIASLSDRWTESLTPSETHTVALAEAVTSKARVLLLEEPLVDLEPQAYASLTSTLRVEREGGACIVIGTSSPRDALDLSDEQWILDRGRLVALTRATDPRVLSSSPQSRLRVVARDTRVLLGALASEPHFAKIEMDGEALLLRGTDATAMAESVSRAALGAGVELEVMRLEASTLDELRAAEIRRPRPLPIPKEGAP